MKKRRRSARMPPGMKPAGLCVVGHRSRLRFATREEAEAALAAAREHQNERRAKRVETNVYRCPWCGDFHLTSHYEERGD